MCLDICDGHHILVAIFHNHNDPVIQSKHGIT